MGSIGNLYNPPLYAKRFYFDDYSLTTVVATTVYTSHTLTNVELFKVYLKQDNTTPQANNITLNITVDTELFTIGPAALADNTPYYVGIDPPPSPDVGELNELSLSASEFLLGFPAELQAGGEIRNILPLQGHSITITWALATIGTAQEMHIDAYYYKTELSS